MTYRLLLDEISKSGTHTLRHYGHDVEHVDGVQKGQTDLDLSAYSKVEDRLIVTSDDDFVYEIAESAYRAAVYVEDSTVSASTVAEGVQTMSQLYPHDEVQGLEYLDPWL